VDSPSNTVLVVDDDAAIRFLCRVNLELEGWTVREAASVSEARAAVAETQVAVVLLDVHLGSGDGFVVLEHLDGQRVGLFTGSLEVEPAHRERVDAVLTKPFTISELSETVAGLAAATA
jgi:DNA-binding NtrC family response regulator